jgi:ubiquinone/menaquinone biosynthesis C-methylase UbiE
MTDNNHLHAGVAGFNNKADAYDHARPRFPLDAIRDVLASLSLDTSDSGTNVAMCDLAAGTGIFTRNLLAVLQEQSQLSRVAVDAVEPVAGMREKLTETTSGAEQLRRVLEGTAQRMPVADGSYDVVWIAQAFHWFATIESLREVRRVLKPGGTLVLVWNMEDRDAAAWLGELRDVYEQYDIGVPQYRKGTWREVWQTDEAKALFGDLVPRAYTHAQLRTRAQIHQLVSSKSYIAKNVGLSERLAPTIDAILDKAFAAQEQKQKDKTETDGGERTLSVPYATHTYSATVRNSKE